MKKLDMIGGPLGRAVATKSLDVPDTSQIPTATVTPEQWRQIIANTQAARQREAEAELRSKQSKDIMHDPFFTSDIHKHQAAKSAANLAEAEAAKEAAEFASHNEIFNSLFSFADDRASRAKQAPAPYAEGDRANNSFNPIFDKVFDQFAPQH